MNRHFRIALIYRLTSPVRQIDNTDEQMDNTTDQTDRQTEMIGTTAGRYLTAIFSCFKAGRSQIKRDLLSCLFVT